MSWHDLSILVNEMLKAELTVRVSQGKGYTWGYRRLGWVRINTLYRIDSLQQIQRCLARAKPTAK